MQSSNGGVLKGRANNVPVVNYQPDKIEQISPKHVQKFLMLQQSKGSEFRPSPEVAEITKLVDIEKDQINERVEQETLARLKVLEESAYKAAYQLGIEEGRNKAFDQYSSELQDQIKRLTVVAEKLETMLGDMHAASEDLLVKMVFAIAQKIIMKEVERNDSLIIEVLKGALGEVRNEESIKVLFSNQDFEFINQNRSMLSEIVEEMNRFHFEAVDSVEPGGCIIETNFGVIDAQMSERVQRVWDALDKEIPQPTDIRRG